MTMRSRANVALTYIYVIMYTCVIQGSYLPLGRCCYFVPLLFLIALHSPAQPRLVQTTIVFLFLFFPARREDFRFLLVSSTGM